MGHIKRAHDFPPLSNRLKTGPRLSAESSASQKATDIRPFCGTSISMKDLSHGIVDPNAPPTILAISLLGPVRLQIWEIICILVRLDYDGFSRAHNSGSHQVQDHRDAVRRQT